MRAKGRNVIYFPYIRVPDNEWFNRVLLYWDQIGSIVPGEYANDPSQLGDYMNGLVKHKLVKPINPRDYTYEIPKFTESFLMYVDNPTYPILPDPNQRLMLPTTRIHVDKMAGFSGLIQGLIQRKLARPEAQFPWYDVETYTANQFMAYLAACLGNLREINSMPVTDTARFLRVFDPISSRDAILHSELDHERTLILEDILPSPSSTIPPAEIARFKQRYNQDLKRFRNKIENVLIDAAGKNPDLKKRKIDLFIDETRDDIEYLTEQMKNAGWQSITVGSIFAFGKAAYDTTYGWLSTGLFGAAKGAMEFPSAFQKLLSEYRGDEILKGQYAAYAILAQRKFG